MRYRRMNVFVLSSGRTGTVTFAAACKHIKGYSVGHEENVCLTGEDRFSYPDNHIEVDNRLSWLLGRLDSRHNSSTFYVHLTRDPKKVYESYFRRRNRFRTIVNAYHEGILMRADAVSQDSCKDLVHTIDANIKLFLKDKEECSVTVSLENIESDFFEFIRRIGAEIDEEKALKALRTSHNSSPGNRLVALVRSYGSYIRHRILRIPTPYK